MKFVIKTIDHGECREFVLYNSVLEDGLNEVSRLAVFCERLVNVQLIDDTILYLPPQAFDGHPISFAINSLEQQWQEALQNPIAVPTSIDPLIKIWYEQQIGHLQTNIASLQRIISVLKDDFHYPATLTNLEDASQFYITSCHERNLSQFHSHLITAQNRLENYQLLLSE